VAYSIWNLGYDERPDYNLLIKYFRKQIKILNQGGNDNFDWNVNEDISRLMSSQGIQEALGAVVPSSNQINYFPEIRHRAFSIDIPGTIKEHT
jgi:catalase